MVLRVSQWRAAFAALVFFGCGGALAASLDVNPVRLDLAGPNRPAELRLTNTGAEELSVQIDIREWSQDLNGSDQLFDTDQLLAVPPLFTIPPGERQIVRVGLLGQASPDVEKSFRLVVTELAQAATEASASALTMRLRLSIPIFVAPSFATARPEIVLAGVDDTEDGANMTLRNVGNAHVKLQRVDVLDRGEWLAFTTETPGLVRYLLPNTEATLHIPHAAENLRAVRIKSTDGRDWEHAVQRAP